MVHRPADSRLLTNLLLHEKEYSKSLLALLDASNASLASFAAYSAASQPPVSTVILSVTGSFAAADDALRRYAHGVDEWREAIRQLKDMEDEVGNIMRDREILVTRLIKASNKSQKSSSSNLLMSAHHRMSSSSSVSLHDSPRPLSASFTSSGKLAAAQSELQACEAHLAAKERELSLKRAAAIHDGLGARVRALIECGWAWNELGKEAQHTLQAMHLSQRSPEPFRDHPPQSDYSSIGPSQSASQFEDDSPRSTPPPVNIAALLSGPHTFHTSPEPTEPNYMQTPNYEQNQNPRETPSQPSTPIRPSISTSTTTDPRRPLSGLSFGTTASSMYYTPATYTVEAVKYAPAVSVMVSGPPPGIGPRSEHTSPLFNSYTPGVAITNGSAEENESQGEVKTRLRIPPAHAIGDYETIPVEEEVFEPPPPVPMRTGEGLQEEDAKGPMRSVLGRKITEEDLKRASVDAASVELPKVDVQEEAPAPHQLQEEEVEVENTLEPPVENQVEEQHTQVHNEKPTSSAPEEVQDDEEEEESLFSQEKSLLDQGKLHIVDNPRFAPASSASSSHPPPLDPLPSETTPKRGSPFLPAARTPRVPSSDPGHGPSPLSSAPGPTSTNVSPSKRFLGSIRGFFGGTASANAKHAPVPSSPSPTKQQMPKHTPVRSATTGEVVVYEDSSDEEAGGGRGPPPSGLQAFFRGKGRDKDRGGVSKWETRTDRNLREVARGGSFDEGGVSGRYTGAGVGGVGLGLSYGGPGVGGGVGLGGAPRRGRAGSDVSSNVVGGRGKLRKARAGGGGSDLGKAGASSPPPLPTAPMSPRASKALTPGPVPSIASTITPMPKVAKRRSASLDLEAEKRIAAKIAGGSGGGYPSAPSPASAAAAVVDKGKQKEGLPPRHSGVAKPDEEDVIVDLGRTRRRAASQDVDAGRGVAPVPVVLVAAVGGSGESEVRKAAGAKGYESDTAAVRSSRAGVSVPATATPPPVKRKRSLTKKRAGGTPAPSSPPPPIPTPAVQKSLGLGTVLSSSASPTTAVKKAPSTRSPAPAAPQTSTSTLTTQPPTTTTTANTNRPPTPGNPVILTTGRIPPSGVLVSQPPGWTTHAQGSGGGLSRNASLVGSAASQGHLGGGAGVQRRMTTTTTTTLGQGMNGSGTAGMGVPKRTGSAKVVSGHAPASGGGGGGGLSSGLAQASGMGGSTSAARGTGGSGSLVQPTPPASSLMQIVEDVARQNREGWKPVVRQREILGDVIRAPKSWGREALLALDKDKEQGKGQQQQKVVPGGVGREAAQEKGRGEEEQEERVGGMVLVKAPGSVFDQRAAEQGKAKVGCGGGEASYKPTASVGSSPAGSTALPSHLKSAMRSTSRTPSPSPGPVPAPGFATVLMSPPPIAPALKASRSTASAATIVPGPGVGRAIDSSGGVQRRKSLKGKERELPIDDGEDDGNGEESTDTVESYETGHEGFSTTDEESGKEEVGLRRVDQQRQQQQQLGNGRPSANGYANPNTHGHSRGMSEMSDSTTSTAMNNPQQLPPPIVANAVLPPVTSHSSMLAGSASSSGPARKRKSVRVSLKPTFSPSPPAIEYDEEKEFWTQSSPPAPVSRQHQPHKLQPNAYHHQEQTTIAAPVPLTPATQQEKVLPRMEEVADMWADSDEEEEGEYRRAKLLLTRAAKKEKDVKDMVRARARG